MSPLHQLFKQYDNNNKPTNMKPFPLLLISIMFLFSCTNKETSTNANFPAHKELKAIKHLSSEILFPNFMTITGNILSISSTLSDSMLYHYSLPEMELIENTGSKGNAEDEFSAFPMFCSTPADDALYVWGYKPNSIKKFVVNDQNELEYAQSFAIDYHEFNNMNVVRDSLFIYYDIDNLEIKKHNLHKNVPIDNVQLKKEDHKESYFYSNRGTIAANDSFIVHAYLFKNRIDIYDVKTLELKTVIGNKSQNPNITVGDFNNLRYQYLNVVAAKDCFYVLYSGEKRNDTPKNNKVEVYDYQGNPISEYKFDIPPAFIVVDEKNQMMYGFNAEYQDYLLSYEM